MLSSCLKKGVALSSVLTYDAQSFWFQLCNRATHYMDIATQNTIIKGG